MWSIITLLLVSFGSLMILGHELDIVTRNSNNFLYKGQMVNDTNLHEFLENHEREFIFGNNPENYSYKLLNVITKTTRMKRSADPLSNVDSRKIKLNLRLERNESQPMRISMQRSTNLVDENFVFIQRFEGDDNSIDNRTRIVDRSAALEGLRDCFYRSSNAALDLCDSNRVQGIFRYRNEEYLIFPLPDRFGKRTVHILTPSTKSRYQLIHKHDYPELLDRKKRAIGAETSSPTNSTTKKTKPKVLHIETAIFVDKDLYHHMAKNYPKNTETHIIRFVLAMINAVQLLYHHPSLGREINFVLKRLEILHKDPKDLRRSSDIDIFLNSFCLWQRKFNPVSDTDATHFDHAVILTGLDLYVVSKNGKTSSQVVGLAPVAGMCTATSSCTINEGKHFESVFVVAHEIGHNLGMRHDTSENNCDPHLFIMSPTLGSGKTTWSSCSRDYLDKFLDSTQSRCMFDRGQFGNSLDHAAEGLLPGERFDADQQCALKYGRESLRSRTQSFNDICRDLHCQRDRYTWTSHPALEGTYCGHSKWCRSGVCVLRSVESFSFTRQLVSTKNGQVSNLVSDHSNNYGEIKEESLNTKKLSIWTDWSDPTECESGCLYGESGRLREGSTGLSTSTRSCTDYRSNRKRCFGQNRKYETCMARQCFNLQRTSILEFANQICNRAKEFDAELTGNGLQVVSLDPDDSCKVSCQAKSGPAKSKGWTFPDGTSCRVKGNDVDDESFCVNGRCETFTCENSTNNLFRLNPDYCPQNQILEGSEQVTNSIVQENGRDYKNMDDVEEYYVENTTYAKVRRDYNTDATTMSTPMYNSWRIQDTKAEKLVSAQSSVPVTWEVKSGCHYSCLDSAKGVQVLVASNSASNIKLCQPDSLFCDKLRTTTEFASNLCSRYMMKVRGLSGKGMQISPTVEDPDRSCKIACQDEFITHRYYLVNGEQGHYPFGTKCSKSDGRYCIRGRCLEFGIDDMPVLESKINVNRNILVPYYAVKRRKRSFLYYPNVNITEAVDQRLLNDLLADFHLHIQRGGNNLNDGLIDMNSPIYITDDFY